MQGECLRNAFLDRQTAQTCHLPCKRFAGTNTGSLLAKVSFSRHNIVFRFGERFHVVYYGLCAIEMQEADTPFQNYGI